MLTKCRFYKVPPEQLEIYPEEKSIIPPVRRNFMNKDGSSYLEFRRIAKLYNKELGYNERKSFSIILSPSPDDKPTAKQLVIIADAVMKWWVPDIPYVVSVHFDKGADSQKKHPVMHAHIIGSTINPITGRKLHLSNKERREMKNFVDNFVVAKFGWMRIVPRKKSRGPEANVSKLERLKNSGEYSWKEDLRQKVINALNSSSNAVEFFGNLTATDIGILYRKSDGTLRQDIGFQFLSKNGKVCSCSASRLDESLVFNASAKMDELRRMLLESSKEQNRTENPETKRRNQITEGEDNIERTNTRNKKEERQAEKKATGRNVAATASCSSRDEVKIVGTSEGCGTCPRRFSKSEENCRGCKYRDRLKYKSKTISGRCGR